MRRWTAAPAGASLSTTSPRTLRSRCSGSYLAPSAPSSQWRWSATCSQTSARALALWRWPTTTRRWWPFRVWTGTHWATECCRCPSRRASARLAKKWCHCGRNCSSRSRQWNSFSSSSSSSSASLVELTDKKAVIRFPLLSPPPWHYWAHRQRHTQRLHSAPFPFASIHIGNTANKQQTPSLPALILFSISFFLSVLHFYHFYRHHYH